MEYRCTKVWGKKDQPADATYRKIQERSSDITALELKSKKTKTHDHFNVFSILFLLTMAFKCLPVEFLL